MIRIAWHSGGQLHGMPKIVSRITFGEDAPRSRPFTMRISDGAFDRLVAVRIGEYMLSSCGKD